MRILLTNDDGVYAAGISALARELIKHHDVTIVAPDYERSGASHSITLTTPLRLCETELAGIHNAEVYRLNGTPADCVIIGCNMLNAKPDVVLAGINHGYNLGTDAHYSGTIAAATEGALLGVPSMAVSMRMIESNDFSTAARIAAELLPKFMQSRHLLYNLNVPDLDYACIKGIKYTRLSSRTCYTPLEKRTDPRNRDYYWWPSRVEYDYFDDDDNDERWTRDGYATVTPLLINGTDERALAHMSAVRERTGEV